MYMVMTQIINNVKSEQCENSVEVPLQAVQLQDAYNYELGECGLRVKSDE